MNTKQKTTTRLEQGLGLLREAHAAREVPDAPLGFNGRIMAEIRDLHVATNPLDRLLPRFTMGALGIATLAIVYAVSLLNTVPEALAAMYVSL